MKIRVASVGSRGDLQPFLPLTRGLLKAGHDVRFVANSDLKELAQSHAVPFDDLEFTTADILKSSEGGRMLSSGSALGSRKHLIRMVAARILEIGPRVIDRCRDADLILTNETLYLLGQSIAEKTGARQVSVCLIPWGSSRSVTGYWFLGDEKPFSPDPALARFLESGPPPICVGFDSMVHDPVETLKMLAEANRATGERFLFLSGWSDSEGLRSLELPASIHVSRELPHSWIFPRVSAVLHHGGAGTTAAVISAGIPQMISWFIVDQAFWARRIGDDLGPQRKLTTQKLVMALRRLRSEPKRNHQARDLGERVRTENGIEQAIAAVSRMIAV